MYLNHYIIYKIESTINTIKKFKTIELNLFSQHISIQMMKTSVFISYFEFIYLIKNNLFDCNFFTNRKFLNFEETHLHKSNNFILKNKFCSLADTIHKFGIDNLNSYLVDNMNCKFFQRNLFAILDYNHLYISWINLEIFLGIVGINTKRNNKISIELLMIICKFVSNKAFKNEVCIYLL